MIHSNILQGLEIRTGDILCCSNGGANILPGEFWRLLGRIVPGQVDHCVIYLGPAGRCVEAGPLGVISFAFEAGVWDAGKMMYQRGLMVDQLFGVVSPLEGLGLAPEEEERQRDSVAAYCFAQLGKPYNLNFFNPETEDAFYCSQLAYKAYRQVGINLNAGLGVPALAGSEQIVYPQEIWLHGGVQKKFPGG